MYDVITTISKHLVMVSLTHHQVLPPVATTGTAAGTVPPAGTSGTNLTFVYAIVAIAVVGLLIAVLLVIVILVVRRRDKPVR